MNLQPSANHFTCVYYAFFLRQVAGKPCASAAGAAADLAQRLASAWQLGAQLPTAHELLAADDALHPHCAAQAPAPNACCQLVQLYLYTWHDSIILVALAYDENGRWEEVARAFDQAQVSLQAAAPAALGTSVLYHAELPDLGQAQDWLDHPSGPLLYLGASFPDRCSTHAGPLALISNQQLPLLPSHHRPAEAAQRQPLSPAPTCPPPSALSPHPHQDGELLGGFRSWVLLSTPSLADPLNELFVLSPYPGHLPPFIWAELARYKIDFAWQDYQGAAQRLYTTAHRLEERLVAWLSPDRTPLLALARAGLRSPDAGQLINQLADDMGLHGRFVAVMETVQRQLMSVEVNVANYYRHVQELTGRHGPMLACDARHLTAVRHRLAVAVRQLQLQAATGAQLIDNIRAQLELLSSHEEARSAAAINILTVVFAVIATALGVGQVRGQLWPQHPLQVLGLALVSALAAWLVARRLQSHTRP
jgi:hypothetical protein